MDFQIGFTNKEITPWGGMALMKKMMERCNISDLISILGFPELVRIVVIELSRSSRVF